MRRIRRQTACGKRYRLAAWLWKGAEGEPLAGVPAGLHSAAALETVLPKVVHAAQQELDDDQMRIEVILPRELLELKIEGAPFPNGLDQVPIGFEWPVVVRSYDRLYDDRNYLLAQRKWKRKWRRLTQPLAANDIAWACESAAYSPQFLAGLDAQTLAFVAFTLTPAACADCTTASHVLNKMLTTASRSRSGCATTITQRKIPNNCCATRSPPVTKLGRERSGNCAPTGSARPRPRQQSAAA